MGSLAAADGLKSVRFLAAAFAWPIGGKSGYFLAGTTTAKTDDQSHCCRFTQSAIGRRHRPISTRSVLAARFRFVSEPFQFEPESCLSGQPRQQPRKRSARRTIQPFTTQPRQPPPHERFPARRASCGRRKQVRRQPSTAQPNQPTETLIFDGKTGKPWRTRGVRPCCHNIRSQTQERVWI